MSFEVDECAELYKEKIVTARIEHRCDACGEKIEKGHRYNTVFVLSQDDVFTHKRCLRCQEIHRHLRELAPGEMWPFEDLGCGEDYEKEWGEKPPPEIERLAFMTQEESQKDGRLRR